MLEQMGSGIAHVVALGGFDVPINDIRPEAIDRAVALIEKNMQRQVSKGIIAGDAMSAALKRIKAATSVEQLADCDLVIEAATEDESIKRKIFADLCPKLKPGALVATNTSSISITRLARDHGSAELFIGMHFMNRFR